MTVVFLGPTLSLAEARQLLPEATFCPPVAQGDVWRAALQHPRAIGIIDGYFERLPAVWHKEILWAMSQGIHVYGAASMGALRAAELQPYGMVGVGSVYEGYLSGELERDDEVAIVHTEEPGGYAPLSVALVDIRATVRAAREVGILSKVDADALLEAASACHYSERRWPLLLANVVPSAQGTGLDEFVHWLATDQRSQKADDACAMLALMKQRLAEDAAPLEVSYQFEHTYFWNEACRRTGRDPLAAETDASEAIVDELRLLGEDRYESALGAAAARLLALDWASERGFSPSPQQVEAAWADLSLRYRLEDASQRQEWLDRQRVNASEFDHWIQREATYRHLLRAREAALPAHLRDALRASGEYGALLDRASLKRAGYSPQATAPDAEKLLRWYYTSQRQEPVPSPLSAAAKRLGLADGDVWLRVLERELEFAGRRGGGG